MSTSSPPKTNDSAKGPLAGYLFQFEKALLALVELENPLDFISIEEVDDVTTHAEDGAVLLTIQAKHSISNSGSTFEDTSSALWRTLEIWISKLETGLFTDNTVFICATNKKIPQTSLLYKITNSSFDEAVNEINQLLKKQKGKLKEATTKNANAGSSIKETIRLIKLILKKKDCFKVVQANLRIEDNVNVKDKFLSKLHLGAAEITALQKDNIYHTFYGWIIDNSKAKWLNDKEARLTKDSFDSKWYQIGNNPSIVNAIFRTKESLGSIGEHEILKKKKELFVRQIEDIDRRKDAKARIIRDAILNFIYTDIELKHVIEKGDYTEEDFKDFLKQCRSTWQSTFDQKVLKEIDEYTDEEKNKLAIDIFDTVMDHIKLEFKEGFCFTPGSLYVRKGCFLQLSNTPAIGWHPEWEKKYK